MPSRSRDRDVAHLRKTGARKRKDSLWSSLRAGARRVVRYAFHRESTLWEHGRVAGEVRTSRLREAPSGEGARWDDDRDPAQVEAYDSRGLSALAKVADLAEDLRLTDLPKSEPIERAAGRVRIVRIVAVVVAEPGETQNIVSDRFPLGAQIVRQRLRSKLRTPVFDQHSDRRNVPVAAALDPLEVKRSSRRQRYHRAPRVHVSVVVGAVAGVSIVVGAVAGVRRSRVVTAASLLREAGEEVGKSDLLVSEHPDRDAWEIGVQYLYLSIDIHRDREYVGVLGHFDDWTHVARGFESVGAIRRIDPDDRRSLLRSLLGS